MLQCAGKYHSWLRTLGTSMTVRESLFQRLSLTSRGRPHAAAAFRVPSASLRKEDSDDRLP